MPIACTRCGASEEGEILTAPIAFAFKHELGCGHGVGPRAVIKGSTPKKSKKKKSEKLKDGEVPWEKSADTEDTVSSTASTETEAVSSSESS